MDGIGNTEKGWDEFLDSKEVKTPLSAKRKSDAIEKSDENSPYHANSPLNNLVQGVAKKALLNRERQVTPEKPWSMPLQQQDLVDFGNPFDHQPMEIDEDEWLQNGPRTPENQGIVPTNFLNRNAIAALQEGIHEFDDGGVREMEIDEDDGFLNDEQVVDEFQPMARGQLIGAFNEADRNHRIATLTHNLRQHDLPELKARALATLLVTGTNDEINQIPEDLLKQLAMVLATPQGREGLHHEELTRLVKLATKYLTTLEVGGDNSGYLNAIKEEGLAQKREEEPFSELHTLKARATTITKDLLETTQEIAGYLTVLDFPFQPDLPKPDLTRVDLLDQWLGETKELISVNFNGRSWDSKETLPTLIKKNPHLTALQLRGWKMVTDETLAQLGTLAHLRFLSLDRCPNVTDEGIQKVISEDSKLEMIHLPKQITSDGIAHLFDKASKLTELGVNEVDPNKLDLLAEKIPEGITELQLYDADEMTDAHMQAILERCPNLETLGLGYAPKLTLEAFRERGANLRHLDVSETGIKEAEEAQLHLLLPDLETVSIVDLTPPQEQ